MERSTHCFASVAARRLQTCGVIIPLVAACLLFNLSSRAQETPRRVLMLYAFNYTFPATTAVGEAARNRLVEGSTKKIEIDADFLDLARIADAEHESRMADFLRQKYA